jgi:hypothetical protein
MGADTPHEKRNAVEGLRWMVEEFKVSLFAPELRTAFPISPKRLVVKIKEIEADMEPRPGSITNSEVKKQGGRSAPLEFPSLAKRGQGRFNKR